MRGGIRHVKFVGDFEEKRLDRDFVGFCQKDYTFTAESVGLERQSLLLLQPTRETAMDQSISCLEMNDASEVIRVMKGLDKEISSRLEPVKDKLTEFLSRLAGSSFGSLEANKDVVREIQQILNRLGLRIKCPRRGCGEAAIIRCRPAPRTKHGTFQFEHTIKGRRTIHAGRTRLPSLEVVKQPLDGRRRRAE